MRLVQIENDGAFTIVKFVDRKVPPYAVLSHTWELTENELTLKDVQYGTGKTKSGFAKLLFCREQAIQDNLRHFWIDTCCIDQSSYAELNEAVNSTFRWYRSAAVCYVFLSDVSIEDYSTITKYNAVTKSEWDSGLEDKSDVVVEWEERFRNSKWFARGWTLPELIAPSSVRFFSREGVFLGTKASLLQIIHEITRIPPGALQNGLLSQYSTSEKLSWSSGRQTTRPEDLAYSLLGIFGVYLPPVYGEGYEWAFRRFQREVQLHERVRNQLRMPKIRVDSFHEQGDLAPHSDAPNQSPLAGTNDEESLEPHANIQTQVSPGAHRKTLFKDPLDKGEFRLLTIKSGNMGSMLDCRLNTLHLEDPPPFHALSYEWRQEPEIHRIRVNGHLVSIRPNLFHAIQRIRLENASLVLWVDTLCINQHDECEKSNQITRIAEIFGKAEGVFIWLGEEDSTSRVAMEFTEKLLDRTLRWDGRWWEQHELAALAKLLERDWFRRAWVIQEAAFSRNSTIQCGEQQVHMDFFAESVRTVRARLQGIDVSLVNHLANFEQSPATKLLDLLDKVFEKSEDGTISGRKMSLENLVDLTTASETTDHRDTIFALLNLANNVELQLEPDQSSAEGIFSNYGRSLLDAYSDFVTHCAQSGNLDIICRAWAPKPLAISWNGNGTLRNKQLSRDELPSWILSRDKLPFGCPSERATTRLHADSLVGNSFKRTYNAHFGTKPVMRIGRKEQSCDGSLYVKGIMLGTIAKVSPRMASAIVSRECLSILGKITQNQHSPIFNIPDVLWRTLCADRDSRKDPAPTTYRSVLSHLMRTGNSIQVAGDYPNPIIHELSFDVEELLEGEIPPFVRDYLQVVKGTVWNRRTFRGKGERDQDRSLVGLAPHGAIIDDVICVLYGCSVPVVLRRQITREGGNYWTLIGETYVHGYMDGEALQPGASGSSGYDEVEFEIR